MNKFFILFICIIILCIIVFSSYQNDMKTAYEKLVSYDTKVINTEFGEMSYIVQGEGSSILISHGIFGGYDQGYISLKKLVREDCKKISISRFGYPGSDLPEDPSPKNQAKVFKELLDELKIKKSYILCTSAGGAAGLQFALNYPEHTKGLILLSSGAPDKKRTKEELGELGMMGPPNFIVNDFPMWFSLKYFAFAFNSMLGSNTKGNNLLDTMLPVSLRRNGVIADTEITNIDMTLNYDKYPLEKIKVPVLVIHAKDDTMAKYDNIEKLLSRLDAEAVIYETGGHMLEGNDCYSEIKKFIESIK